MPKAIDIEKVLVIGSGPIQIGQAAEFDFSGSQACRALREEGVKVVLVNSNPATIMTDFELADVIYMEPLVPEVVAKIVEKERPDGILAGLGGQTALNLTAELAERGVLSNCNVRVLGTPLEAIYNAEERERFKQTMERINEPIPRGFTVKSVEEAEEVAAQLGLPLIIRPSYTLGGTGGGIARTPEELSAIVSYGLQVSRIHQVLVEESVLGWKEIEYEVMRDAKDTCITICNMENLDPMGIHTGESIVVTPSQTLSDEEHQMLRAAAIKIIRSLKIAGGCNIQFALKDGAYRVIEVNPRVSRSSALASKATGYPIARVAAKIAIGLHLDEIQNDVTKETPASFEPAIDYVVVKIPRWPFDKFPEADRTLTTSMKSTGEVMAIGRTFEEALQKAVRSLEVDKGFGFGYPEWSETELRQLLATPTDDRIFVIYEALKKGFSIEEIARLSNIDPFFIKKIEKIVRSEEGVKSGKGKEQDLNPENLKKMKRMGFADEQIARLTSMSMEEISDLRRAQGITPTYKMVDTCAAEFEAKTPYFYSTYEAECELKPSTKKKVLIIGAGPIRIGQGIEFDYCTVHAVKALKEEGIETHIINNNPETVSTDYDTSDRLYFEPLTYEDVLSIVDIEKPTGVIVQFGGQTPLKLAVALEKAGVPIIGTSPDSIDRAEDRERFQEMLHKLGLRQPENGTARSFEEAEGVADRIGYPVVVRPSYVLGGRAMEIVYDVDNLRRYMHTAVQASPEHPILIDKFLDEAIEIDVDALCDGTDVVIGGIMEHIEEAGIHSGDSACSLPPYSISDEVVAEIRRQTVLMALELNVKGLMNVQYALKDGVIYILEVNPRASRTSPFVSKATGRPLAKIAASIMGGRSLKEQGITSDIQVSHIAVKESVFPFVKFPGVDTLLGPEMKSTGEVMGIDATFAKAFAKAQLGAGTRLPREGKVFISVKDTDKKHMVSIARNLADAGFTIVATRGTATYLQEKGVAVQTVNKVLEGRPHIVDSIKNAEIAMVINTTHGPQAVADSFSIRRETLIHGITYFTTVAAARAAVDAILSIRQEGLDVKPLQDYLA